MFDIGFSEVLLIFALTLVVLGPDKLPQVARTVGRWAGRARAMARQFRDQLEAETDGLKVDLKPVPPVSEPPPAPPPATTPEPEPTAPSPEAAPAAAAATKTTAPAAEHERHDGGA